MAELGTEKGVGVEPLPRSYPEAGLESYAQDLERNRLDVGFDINESLPFTILYDGKLLIFTKKIGSGATDRSGKQATVVFRAHFEDPANPPNPDDPPPKEFAVKATRLPLNQEMRNRRYREALIHRALTTGEIMGVRELEVLEDSIIQRVRGRHPEHPDDAYRAFNRAMTVLHDKDDVVVKKGLAALQLANSNPEKSALLIRGIDGLDDEEKDDLVRAAGHPVPQHALYDGIRLAQLQTDKPMMRAPKIGPDFYGERIVGPNDSPTLLIFMEDYSLANEGRRQQLSAEGRLEEAPLHMVSSLWHYIHAEDSAVAAGIDEYLTTEDRLRAAMGMCFQLRKLHRRGITHRDIKPMNMMIDPEHPFNVMLFDFGLSEYPDEPMVDYDASRIQGSPLFSPPEVLPDSTLKQDYYMSKERDVYSLALSLYFLFYGFDDFQKSGSAEEAMKYISEHGNPFKEPEIFKLRVAEAEEAGQRDQVRFIRLIEKMLGPAAQRPTMDEVTKEMFEIYEPTRKKAQKWRRARQQLRAALGKRAAQQEERAARNGE